MAMPTCTVKLHMVGCSLKNVNMWGGRMVRRYGASAAVQKK